MKCRRRHLAHHVPVRMAAFRLAGRRAAARLADAVERALTERRAVVVRRGAGMDSAAPGAPRRRPSHQETNKIHGVAALDIAPRPEPELEAVLR